MDTIVRITTRPLRLRELPVTETPRMRLRDSGSAALADAELLAILLRSGIAGANALDLARQLLTSMNHNGQGPVGTSPLMSVSRFSDQNCMPMSAYMVIAVAMCSCALRR